ncbi:hypothetical protein SETIT_8G039700v2 [Setaria italica]|uniref:Uncharacterized protein n=1 Tax=Setaria italica TaxID=4555 RepID=A0A368S480_SETIT|nr:hypothetical protein SETIT_8G039700v2 [Setaria italica]
MGCERARWQTALEGRRWNRGSIEAARHSRRRWPDSVILAPQSCQYPSGVDGRPAVADVLSHPPPGGACGREQPAARVSGRAGGWSEPAAQWLPWSSATAARACSQREGCGRWRGASPPSGRRLVDPRAPERGCTG